MKQGELCPIANRHCDSLCAWYDPERGGCAMYVIGSILAESLDYARERNGDDEGAGE